MSVSTSAAPRTGARVHVQRFGTFLSNMVLPNIGAFIAWGLITALFIKTGWITLIGDKLFGYAPGLDPGQPIRIPLISLTGRPDAPSVTPPDGHARELALLGGEYQTAQTLQPGIHKVSGLRDAAGNPAAQMFAVRRPVAESDLSWMPPEEAAAFFQKGTGSVAEQPTPRAGRWPLAFWFAVLTALLFLAEAVLAHLLVRRREARGRRIDLKPVF